MNIVKQIRRETGLNQPEFGELIGVTAPMVSFYERGVKTPIVKRARAMVLIAKTHGLDLTLDDFYNRI